MQTAHKVAIVNKKEPRSRFVDGLTKKVTLKVEQSRGDYKDYKLNLLKERMKSV